MKHRDPNNRRVPLEPDTPDVVAALGSHASLDLAIVNATSIDEVHATASALGIKPTHLVEHYSPDDAERIDAAMREVRDA